MAEINEYELQALWWKRVLSAFTARLDRDDLESVLRLIWPYTAKLYAGIQLSRRRQAARDDAVFNELIARLDEEDDDSDG